MKLNRGSHSRKIAVLFLMALTLVWEAPSLADMSEYREFIMKVSEDISKLKQKYPQLVEFSPEWHVDTTNFKISYGYHTHKSHRSGGWASSVPNPDPDGIWFYIDLHDHNSTAQIHTQPVTGADLRVGDKRVAFLILEGTKTESIAGEISSILKRYGAKSIEHK